jgi:hypothetical protein
MDGVGAWLVTVLRGGSELGAATLARFYAFHVLWLRDEIRRIREDRASAQGDGPHIADHAGLGIRYAGGVRAGRSTSNRTPSPLPFMTRAVPPWRRAIAATSASPRPVPSPLVRASSAR